MNTDKQTALINETRTCVVCTEQMIIQFDDAVTSKGVMSNPSFRGRLINELDIFRSMSVQASSAQTDQELVDLEAKLEKMRPTLFNSYGEFMVLTEQFSDPTKKPYRVKKLPKNFL